MTERPVDERQPPADAPAGELAMARAWLTMLRGGVAHKLVGLTPDELRWKPSPTANSLGTLARHLGLAERLWFRAICAGESMDMGWRATMFDDIPDEWTVEDVVAFYEHEVARADAALDTVSSLDEPSRNLDRPTTWRWAVVHMIEETARHLGHMDITRELIDGQTGR